MEEEGLEYSFQTPLQYHGLLRSPGMYTFNKKKKEDRSAENEKTI